MPPCHGDRDQIRQFPPKDLLASVIDFASNGDADYIEQVHESLKQNKSSAAAKAEDDENEFGGALDELVLLDLPAEERRDFDEVAKAIEKKVKADWNLVIVAKAKGKAKAKAKAKSKAKAKAKATSMAKPVRQAARVFNSRKRRRQAIAPIEDATSCDLSKEV